MFQMVVQVVRAVQVVRTLASVQGMVLEGQEAQVRVGLVA